MGTIDLIILACFLPAIFLGLKNGFIRQSVALAVIFLGIFLSIKFSPVAGQWISDRWQLNPFWPKVIAFAAIFIAVGLVLNLTGTLIEKVLKIAMLGWLNRLLGMAVALVTASLVIGILLFMVNSANDLLNFIPAEKIEESHLYKPLLSLVQWLFPYLKMLF